MCTHLFIRKPERPIATIRLLINKQGHKLKAGFGNGAGWYL